MIHLPGRICQLLCMMLFTAWAGAAGAQFTSGYPTRPIRIHTAGAGAGSDATARLVANEIGTALGQSVVVENRPAGFTLASGVAKAPPDGYTLLVWGGALWLAPLFQEAPYDPIRDFSPIVLLSRSPFVLVVHPALPVRSVGELIKLAKAKPGELNYSSSANGSSSHIAAELLKSMAKLDMVRIEYKGGAQDTADLLSGQVQMTFSGGISATPHIKSGKMRALATSGPKRSMLFPDLPTVAETLSGFTVESLIAFFAPAKTPDAIVKRLYQETVRALEKPEAREQLIRGGQEPVAGGSPEQLADLVKADIARVGKLIKDAGMK